MSAASGGPGAERLAYAALTRLGEPGDRRLSRFVAEHGAEAALAAIVRADADAFGPEALAGYRARLGDADARAGAEADLELLDRIGGRFVCPGDDDWPESIGVLSVAGGVDGRGGPPLGLWLRGRGRLPAAAQGVCAVVGCRAATEYGLYVAAELAAGLADRGITVVSGGAYGIDAAAHRGALAAVGPTIAVLASGVDVPYPRGHGRLFDRIAEEGLLVSEVSPGSIPTRSRFLVRNRLIAALAAGTVVVEAALRSGALSTANWAARCGREVMAVPGPVTSAASAGVHRLVREAAATLVTDAAEVAEQIAPIGQDLAPLPRGEERSRDGLDPLARQVLDAVPVRRPRGVVAIAAAAGVGPDQVVTTLGRLALLGYVERDADGWRLAAAERGRRHHCSAG